MFENLITIAAGYVERCPWFVRLLNLFQRFRVLAHVYHMMIQSILVNVALTAQFTKELVFTRVRMISVNMDIHFLLRWRSKITVRT